MYFFDETGKYGNRTAFLQSDGKQFSYQEIEAVSEAIGKMLPDRSLGFCLCRNSIGSAAGYLSFLKNRMVPLLLDAQIDHTLLKNLIDTYHPAWIYLPASMLDSAADRDGSGDESGAERLFAEMPVIGHVQDYCLLDTGLGCGTALHDDLALLLTTSGSTGSPKLVRQSYRNIQANTESIVEYLQLDGNERPVTSLPMYYTYGLSVIQSHIMCGACILLTDDSVISRNFWAFAKEQKATSVAGVPYTYEMLKRIRFFRMELPSLITMTQAGGKLLPELHREFAEFAEKSGKHFVVMYGQTEATARMGYLPYEKALEKPGSMGIPIPGGRFTLIDAAGGEIHEPDMVGELVYEGDNVTLGYAEKPEDLIRGDERGGRLETGDMAKRDEDGYYYIVGRKKRFLKLFGSRVNLDEVERMLRHAFPETDCACTGQDDMLEVFLTEASYAEAAEQFLLDRTHINQRALRVYTTDAIPRNESGKIIYKALHRPDA